MIIYLLKNKINQMIYVGLSSKSTIKERYRGDWSKRTHNKYLKHAVNFYGKENFEETVLEAGEFTSENLDELERAYIKKYDCLFPKGYNFDGGGRSGRVPNQLTKDKISKNNQKFYPLVNSK